MLRWITRFSCFFILIFAACLVLAQMEFSAEIVDLQKPGTPNQAKIYFAKDKIRIESQGAQLLGFAQTYTYSTLVSFPATSKKSAQTPNVPTIDSSGNIYGTSQRWRGLRHGAQCGR